jgi:hypothetical protein
MEAAGWVPYNNKNDQKSKNKIPHKNYGFIFLVGHDS